MRDLIKRSKKGDKNAFMALMDEHRQMLYNTALLMLKNEDDVLDAMQDTVLSCWENLPTLRENRYFKTWLTRILMNKCYDILRQKQWISDVEPPEQLQERDLDTSLDVKDAMAKLSVDDRVLLSLFYYDGLSVKEIAAALSITEGAVRTRLNRSRNRFKRSYCQEGERI